jgi:hypothetical protein
MVRAFWISSIIILTVFVGLYIGCSAGVARFGKYMTEGILVSPDRRSNVLIALSNDTAVREALLSGCHLVGSLPAPSLKQITSGQLAEVPSGVRMHMDSWGGNDPDIGAMTIAEGRFSGRQVWACRGQFGLLHPWP